MIDEYEALAPLKEALTIGVLRTYPTGFRASELERSRFVARPGLPPYDGQHRASFVDTGMFIRLDLTHPSVPPALARRLRADLGDLIGPDGAIYEYERETRSQRTNLNLALARLAARIAASSDIQ